MNKLKLRALADLELQEGLLRKSSSRGCDNNDVFHEACGRAWAYYNIEVLTLDAALGWVSRFAAAADGKSEEVIA